jgi:3',5'-cyclic AMP phosphodiesterase CpdA
MASSDFLIAQISDIHLGGAVSDGTDANRARLERVLEHLCAMARLPDLLLVTGDLAESGDEDSYRQLKQRLDRCPFPAHVALGNHDKRTAARTVFAYGEGEFLHYSIDAPGLQIVVLDTLEEGRHGGAFCEAREAWLRATLRKAPERPVLVALHHPPIDTGLDWLTTSPNEPWLARLDGALSESRQVVALVAGHVHRPIAASRGGIAVRVCPSVAAPLALDLAALSPELPDGRPLVVDGPPGYALHLWRDGVLTTHFDFVEEHWTILRFGAAVQPFVHSLFSERAG